MPRHLPVQQPSSRNASASPHSPHQVAQAIQSRPLSSSLPPLKVNKETPAQDDLREFLVQDARRTAIAATTLEVTERVAQQVRAQVTKELTDRLTVELTSRVKAKTEHELTGKHQIELQDLKDQYEESA